MVSRSAVALVDASVAVKWLFLEEFSAQADALLQRGLRSDIALVAPTLLPNEVANAIHRRQRRGMVTDVEATDAVGRAERLLDEGVELLAPTDLPWEAFAFAEARGLGAI